MMDVEIAEIQSANAAWMAHKSFIAVVQDGGEWIVVQSFGEGGCPPRVGYPTARAAAARVLQLMHVGPVAPQTWPETAQIGILTEEDTHD